MKRLASDVLNIAAGEIGTTENPSNSNKQKYGEEYGWNGVPWCMQFVWWCFRKACLSLLFYDGGKTAYCPDYVKWAKQNGTWTEGPYKPGDIIFFNFSGGSIAEHVGIVESVSPGAVTTIEGNTSMAGSQSNGGAVLRRYRLLSSVIGAARPAFDEPEEDKQFKVTEEIAKQIVDLYRSSLKDSDSASWSEAARTWAIQTGLVQGDGNGNYAWKDFLTVERFVTILYRYNMKIREGCT